MFQGNKRKIAYGAAILAAIITGLLLIPKSPYQYQPAGPIPGTFEEFLSTKVEAGRKAGTKPYTEERLIRKSAQKTPIAFLYIHGFGACREEGEAVMDVLAEDFKANTYFMRMPGHGTTREDHAKATAVQYLDEAEEALRMMPLLGDKVVVVGTSMGGLLATHLASRHPEQVTALLLASPFYDFAGQGALLARMPAPTLVARLVLGSERDTSRAPGWEPGFERCWYTHQYTSALGSMVDLWKLVAKDHVYQQVKAPTLLLYYYKDEKHQDDAASVKAMLESFAKFGGRAPHPLNRAIAVENGDHVLFSRYKETDKKLIVKEAARFLNAVQSYDKGTH